MGDAKFNKNLTAAEYEAVHIIQAQNPSFKKMEGKELALFYKEFEDHYEMAQQRIEPSGTKLIVISHPLSEQVSKGRIFMNNYNNLKESYEKSVHFLAVAFAGLLSAVQFGFKVDNPDIQKYRQKYFENAQEISKIMKKIKPGLKLKYVSERILKIYHEDIKKVHPFASEFAQELSR